MNAALLLHTSLASPILALVAPQIDQGSPGMQVDDVDAVEVIGRRGAAKVAPDFELNENDIRVLGADDIGQVIAELTERYALGETPTIIVNGRRVSDPGVFTRFPPDALTRVEILPDEANALYGGSPSEGRVVNIVVKRRFESVEGRAAWYRPTAGGTTSSEAALTRSSIIESRVRQLGVEVSYATPLQMDERDLVPIGQNLVQPVTIRPATEGFAVNWVENASFGDWGGSTRVSGRQGQTRSLFRVGSELRENVSRSKNLALTGGINGEIWGWNAQINLDGNFSILHRSGLSNVRAEQALMSSLLRLSRQLVDLPAGPLSADVSFITTQSRYRTEDASQTLGTSSQSFGVRGNVVVPVLRRSSAKNRLSGVGNVTLSTGAEFFDVDRTQNGGANASVSWMPRKGLAISAQWAATTLASIEGQRFASETFGDPIRIFDFRKNESAEVIPLLGGNPALKSPRTDRFALSAIVGPVGQSKLLGSVRFQQVKTVNSIGFLSQPTEELEQVFPNRFKRDIDGYLIGIDARPLNFASSTTRALTANLATKLSLGNGGTVGLSLTHTVQLQNETVIRDGLAPFDRLAGDAGGLPRQATTVVIDVDRGAWSLNTNMRSRGGYRLRRRSGQDGGGDVVVEPLFTVDLRASYRLDRRTGERRNQQSSTEIAFELGNVLDARPSAKLGNGTAAAGYGRDEQDPLGRTVRIALKRRF